MIEKILEKLSELIERLIILGNFLIFFPKMVSLAIEEPEEKLEFEKLSRLIHKILIECHLLERAYAQGHKNQVLKSMGKIHFLAKKALLTDVYLFRLILSENRIDGIFPVYIDHYVGLDPTPRGFAFGNLSLGEYPNEVFVSDSIFHGRNFYEKRKLLLFRPVLEVLLSSQLFINGYRRTTTLDKGFVYDVLNLRRSLDNYSYTGPQWFESAVHHLNYKREMKREGSLLDAALRQDFEHCLVKKNEPVSTSFEDEFFVFIGGLLKESPDFNLINIYLTIAIHSLLESTQSSFGKYDELWELMEDNYTREHPYRNKIPSGESMAIFITGDVVSHVGLSGTTSTEVAIKKLSFVKNNGTIIKRILPRIKIFCEEKNIRNIPIIP